MKRIVFLVAVSLAMCGCTLTSEQRAYLIEKEMNARLELAKLPIATADEAKNLKVYSQDRTMPELPPSDVDKYLDAATKAGFIGLGFYGVHELSHDGDTTTIHNYATGE